MKVEALGVEHLFLLATRFNEDDDKHLSEEPANGHHIAS